MSSRDARCRVYHSEAGESVRRHANATFTIATLVTLAILGNAWDVRRGGEPASSQVTVIYKNRTHPSIGELEDRAAETDQSDDANGFDGLVFHRRSQWI
jgi:hypothetical protein